MTDVWLVSEAVQPFCLVSQRLESVPARKEIPLCGGTMQVVERLSVAELFVRSPPHPSRCAAWIHIPSLESLSCFGAHTGSVSRICQNAVWWCDSDSPMRRPTLILPATRY